MSSILYELRLALRQVRRAPRCSLPAILVLSVGIAVNGAMLSLAEAILRKPLNVPTPHELFALISSNTKIEGYYGSISFPDYFDYQSNNRVFEGLAGYENRNLTVRLREIAEKFPGQVISDNYFATIGGQPERGRYIGHRWTDSDGPGLETVLGFGFWQRHLGGEPEIIGQIIYVDRQPLTVVGIAPQGFVGTDPQWPADLWIQFDTYAAMQPDYRRLMSARDSQMLSCLGRLKPGMDFRRAEREMAALASQLAREYPDSHADWSVVVRPAAFGVIDPSERNEVIRILSAFGAATGLLLVIICTSIASLLLAQAIVRGPEIALRLALGAPRRLLVRGFATEYVVIALLGAGVGLVVTRGLLSIISAFQPSEFFPIGEGFEFRMSGTVATAIVLLSVLAGAISSAVPFLYMFTIDLRSELSTKAAIGSPKPGRKRLWSGFVVGQVGLATVLLVGAGLALESWRGLSAIELGFDPRGVTLLSLDLGSGGYEEVSGLDLYQSLGERLEGQPGMESVALASVVPLGRRAFMRQIAVDDYEPNPDGWTHSLTGNVVSFGYFRTLGIPLLRGRDFNRLDAGEAPGVVIVNESLARTIWPGEEVIGKTFRFVNRGSYKLVEIVGVVRDSWHLRDRRHRHGPHFYVPLAQEYQRRMKVLVKSGLAVAEVRRMVGEQLRRFDPDLAASDLTTLPDVIDASLARERTSLALLGTTSLIALFLAGFGLYATLSYLVARRRTEIGLRMALGARPGEILTLIISRGLGLTSLGLVLGLLIAAVASRLLSDLLYNVETFEPSVYLGVVLLVLGLSVLATFLPARRAARVNPASSLMQSS